MSLFTKGDTVRSNISEQGMIRGQVYKVKEVIHGKFGVVYYDIGLKNLIVNGHFFLDKVCQDCGGPLRADQGNCGHSWEG